MQPFSDCDCCGFCIRPFIDIHFIGHTGDIDIICMICDVGSGKSVRRCVWLCVAVRFARAQHTCAAN